MRRERLRTTDGDWIEALVPETEADVEALRLRQEQGGSRMKSTTVRGSGLVAVSIGSLTSSESEKAG